MAYKLQHMGLGGILDQTIAILKDHFKVLFAIMLLLIVPFNLALGFFNLAVMPKLPPNPTFQDIIAANQVPPQYSLLVSSANLAFALFIVPLANASMIHTVARLYLGQPITALEAIKFGARRFVSLFGTTVLMYLAIFAGVFLCLVGSILFSLWFGLAQHVVVIEGVSGVPALKRSKKLVSPFLGTMLILAFILGLISFAIVFGSWFIPEPHVKVIVTALLQAVTYLTWTTAAVVFYFSCRCAVDNFDLEYLANSIRSEATTDQFGAAR